MPRYTQARLEYALEVFRDSLPYRTKRGFKTENLEQQFKKYDLRTSAPKAVAQRSSLWIDKDDSGDYDPSKSRKSQFDPFLLKGRNNKRKQKELGEDRDNGRALKKKGRTWMSGRRNGDICKVVLKLTFDAGRMKLQKLADAGVPALEADSFCRVEDDQPSLWSLGGGSFRSNSRHSLSSVARRRSMFGPDPGDDDYSEGLGSCGLGLRTRTLPVGQALDVPQASTKCTPCYQAKRKCTQRKLDINPACTQCRRGGIECSFGSAEIQQENTKSLLGVQHDTPVAIKSPVSPCRGTKWITTSFAHPINFKFSAAQEPTQACDFCRDYRYGILGCGTPKNVEVIVEGDKVVEEMGGGFRAEGRELTNMCIMCALDRFQIYRCATHEIVPIAGLRPDDFDYQEAFDKFLTPATPASHHWCSFCVSPAFFACGAPQKYDKVGRRIAPGLMMQNGCGLFLCPACAIALEQVGMDRVKLEEEVRSRGSWKVRADMKFLFHGSDLHKAYYPS